jgi:hypothetical protein
MLKQGVQDEIATIGEAGCYALTLCRIMGLVKFDELGFDMADAVGFINTAISNGFIGKDMTVLDGALFLSGRMQTKWTKEYKDPDYQPKKGDYLIAEWFNKRTGKTHFTLEYPEKWNSLSDSVTVKEGYIKSYRLYRVVK